MVNFKLPKKRTQALRGRNLAREIPVDSATMVPVAWADVGSPKLLFQKLMDARAHASQILG